MTQKATDKSRVDILLATFNGERFVERQIQSVVEQMEPGHRLLVRDDGSADRTVEILRRVVTLHPERVVLLDDGAKHLGPCQSFARLLEKSDADYILLCDQDDVWLPARIALPLRRIQEVEKACGTGTPVLVHSDLAVVDENLRTLAPSFWAYSNLQPESGCGLNRLLVRNVVTGCAVTMNRALLRLACPIPVGAALMHDWWLALVAAAFGRLELIPRATVQYRQHGDNFLGAKRHGWRLLAAGAWDVLFAGGAAKRLHNRQEQARAFLDRFAGQLDARQRTLVEDFISLGKASLVGRRKIMLKHRYFGPGLLRNLAWLAMS